MIIEKPLSKLSASLQIYMIFLFKSGYQTIYPHI